MNAVAAAALASIASDGRCDVDRLGPLRVGRRAEDRPDLVDARRVRADVDASVGATSASSHVSAARRPDERGAVELRRERQRRRGSRRR